MCAIDALAVIKIFADNKKSIRILTISKLEVVREMVNVGRGINVTYVSCNCYIIS